VDPGVISLITCAGNPKFDEKNVFTTFAYNKTKWCEDTWQTQTARKLFINEIEEHR
jgi:hypothetical protein